MMWYVHKLNVELDYPEADHSSEDIVCIQKRLPSQTENVPK